MVPVQLSRLDGGMHRRATLGHGSGAGPQDFRRLRSLGPVRQAPDADGAVGGLRRGGDMNWRRSNEELIELANLSSVPAYLRYPEEVRELALSELRLRHRESNKAVPMMFSLVDAKGCKVKWSNRKHRLSAAECLDHHIHKTLPRKKGSSHSSGASGMRSGPPIGIGRIRWPRMSNALCKSCRTGPSRPGHSGRWTRQRCPASYGGISAGESIRIAVSVADTSICPQQGFRGGNIGNIIVKKIGWRFP